MCSRVRLRAKVKLTTQRRALRLRLAPRALRHAARTCEIRGRWMRCMLLLMRPWHGCGTAPGTSSAIAAKLAPRRGGTAAAASAPAEHHSAQQRRGRACSISDKTPMPRPRSKLRHVAGGLNDQDNQERVAALGSVPLASLSCCRCLAPLRQRCLKLSGAVPQVRHSAKVPQAQGPWPMRRAQNGIR